MSTTTFYATGKRKTAVAKVWLKSGTGTVTIDGKDINAWARTGTVKKRVLLALIFSKQLKSVDVKISVHGGGYSAQADACKHGITKALCEFDNDFRAILKPYGLLTRDSRVVERKKFGRRKARRSPQFSKR